LAASNFCRVAFLLGTSKTGGIAIKHVDHHGWRSGNFGGPIGSFVKFGADTDDGNFQNLVRSFLSFHSSMGKIPEKIGKISPYIGNLS